MEKNKMISFRKKIAFLNIYQNMVDRGAETFVWELSRRLRKNHKVVIFSGEKKIVRRWPILWRFFIDPQGIKIFVFTLKLLPTIWREKFDIVIPVNGGWQPALIRITTWLYGGKMVITGHSGIGWDDINNLWSFPDVFVGISSFAKNWSRKINPFIKSRYIPNGVDIKKFNKSVKTIDISLPRPIVLCVAALNPNKRIELVIRAVAKMNKTSLLLVGKGDQEKYFRKLGKELLGPRFKITSVPYEEMSGIYPAANLFTYAPVQIESFGNVMTEAMAAGLPVVTMDDPIRREIVGGAGLFVDPRNPEAYAKSLERALKISWGDKPRKQAEKFSWEKIAKEYERLFSSLIDKK